THLKRNGLRGKTEAAFHLARNLPYWLREQAALTGPTRTGRIRQIKRVLRRQMRKLARRPIEMEAEYIVDEWRALPPQYLNVVESHVDALRKYAPAKYSGHVVLFRTPQHRLRVSDHDLGWGKLTTEPVRV